MPAGTVDHHGGMFVPVQRLGEAAQERAHCQGGDRRQHQAEIPPALRLYGCEDVGEGVAPIDRPARPLAAQPPAMTAAAFLSDTVDLLRSSTILEEQRDPLARMGARRVRKRCGQHLF